MVEAEKRVEGGATAKRGGLAVVPVLLMVYYAALLLASLALVVRPPEGMLVTRETLSMVGWFGMVIALVTAPVALLIATGMNKEPLVTGVGGERLEMSGAIRGLSEQMALSDDARRVLNRQGERALLCRAIEEDLAAKEWDAALVLCNELAERFGYRMEAEQFRTRIDSMRLEEQRRRVNDAIGHLDGLIVQRRWEDGLREAARIKRLFPDSPRVGGLHQRVEDARGIFKGDLERRFLEAAEQNRIDEAMELLRELDSYLTNAEAEPFREVAKGVIGKARENLGAQFKLAVKDGRWPAAVAIGKRITVEFPNTRMAAEVRQVMDGILTRANQPVAGV